MAVNNALTHSNGSKPVPFSQAIQSEKMKNFLNGAIADEKSRARFVTAIISAVSANPQLQTCEAPSILSAGLQGEALGLSPSAALGEYAIVPYGTKAQFQLMTNGRVMLAMRSGQYADLDTIEIREGEYKGKDKFTGKPSIEFIEDDDERETRPVIGYYAYFKLLNGFFKSAYFSKAKVIEHAKRYSKAFDYNLFLRVQKGETLTDWKEQRKAEQPWIQHFDEMAKTYALRQVLKKGPKSIEMIVAEESEEKSEADLTAVFTEAAVKAEEEFFTDNAEIEAEAKAEAEKTAPVKVTKKAKAESKETEKETIFVQPTDNDAFADLEIAGDETDFFAGTPLE